MARPQKKGLDYFPVDVGLFWDDKIFELTNSYGPRGQTVYMALLCEIYREGYYLEMPVERLASMIIRSAGNRWFNDRNQVIAIIDFCAAIGLLDAGLYAQGVITSRGIQRRYAEVAARRKRPRDKYWLLPDTGPKKKAKTDESETEKETEEDKTSFFEPETGVNVNDNAPKKTKEN